MTYLIIFGEEVFSFHTFHTFAPLNMTRYLSPLFFTTGNFKFSNCSLYVLSCGRYHLCGNSCPLSNSFVFFQVQPHIPDLIIIITLSTYPHSYTMISVLYAALTILLKELSGDKSFFITTVTISSHGKDHKNGRERIEKCLLLSTLLDAPYPLVCYKILSNL